jgi:hypothetical protein
MGPKTAININDFEKDISTLASAREVILNAEFWLLHTLFL